MKIRLLKQVRINGLLFAEGVVLTLPRKHAKQLLERKVARLET